MKLIKKVIDVDISKDFFVIRFGTLDNLLDQQISPAFKFKNNITGFTQPIKTTMKVNTFVLMNKALEMFSFGL